jgi:2,4-dienoyl-CoA reductase-like NADH-dependent reductase (Old Yellow Enzyme family)/thioredoxin reductase
VKVTMEKLVKLFEPGKIGKMEVKNRIVAAPLGYGFTFGTKPNGFLTDRLLAYNETRAKGGVGLIQLTTGSLARPHATTLIFGPGVLNLRTSDHIPGAQRFTKAIHSHGTKVSFLMGHIGAILARQVQARPPVEYPELMRVVAPTGTRDPFTGFQTHTLSTDEIGEIVEEFGRGALRGQEANFDAVLIHGGHGYLIHEFLSPRTNKRTDQYGGSVENRARFGCEIIQAIRKTAGPDFPIIIRMNGDDFLSGGITLDEAIEHAQLFAKAGADALDISSGPFETHQWQFPTMYQPFGTLVRQAVAIKKAVNVPVIAVAKLDAINGERVLKEGSADFIEMGRALMADPDLPNKAREGRLEDIRPCIYCGYCQAHGAGGYSNCTVNMALGKELEYRLEPAATKKKVMVIGGGPAGMEAARTLAERGHDTSLYEKSSALGGQWKILANYRPEADRLINYLSKGMEKAGVKVFLNQVVTARLVEEVKPDAVVVATGSTPTTLDIPGIDSKNVVQATDVLTGRVNVGQDVVIVGGRLVGISAALFLAEKGKNVSIITRSKVGRGLNHNTKLILNEYLVKNRVHLYHHTLPDSITEEGVNCWWDSGEPPNRDNVFFFLKADTIVLAVGAKNEDRLSEELSGLMPDSCYPIGDCAGKRNIFTAMHEGSEAGRKI